MSATVKSRKVKHGRDIGTGCTCETLCDLDLIFDLVLGTLTFKSCLDHISETVRCRKLILG